MIDTTTLIRTQCPVCHEQDDICVSVDGHTRWLNGALIQDAMPELNSTQREQLITGICGPCWDQSFGDC